METNFEIIEKESIYTLRFPNNEVLNEAAAINQRNNDLTRALYLGNIEHAIIKIFFIKQPKKTTRISQIHTDLIRANQ